MIKINEAVIVEGKYDKIKLSGIIDAVIITTDGFGIFKDKEKLALIRKFAQTRGIVILTDSDSAGFLIRSHIRSAVQQGKIINVCLPEINGKERRKQKPSKEGKLGVEGIDDGVILSALERSGVFCEKAAPRRGDITKADFFEDGLSGRPDSSKRREQLSKRLDLPVRMSCNTLLSVINGLMSRDEYKKEVTNLFMLSEENSK